MIPFHPIVTLFEIWTIKINLWAVLLSLGSLLGCFLCIKEAKRKKLPEDEVLYAILLMVFFGFFFMRFFYNLFIEHRTGLSLFDVINAGTISYGAIFGVILSIVLSSLIFKIKIWKLLDCFFPGILLGGIITRLGCHLAGDTCSYGKIMEKVMPWAIEYAGGIRHPTALYELALTIPLFILVLKMRLKNLKDGNIFFLVIGGYLAIRLIVNQFRQDMSGVISQFWIPLIGTIACLLMVLFLNKKSKSKSN